jgi:hypothetical protein
MRLGGTSKRKHCWNKSPSPIWESTVTLNRSKVILHLFYQWSHMVDRIVNAFSYASEYRNNSLKKLLIKVFVRCYQSYSPFVHSPTNRLLLCNNVSPAVMKFFLSYFCQISVTLFTRLRILFWIHWTLYLILFFNIFSTYSYFSQAVASVHLFLLKRSMSSFFPCKLNVPPPDSSANLFACSICFHKYLMHNNVSKNTFIHFRHIEFYFILFFL